VLTGKINSWEVSITPQELILLENKHKNIEDFNLSHTEKEFLLNGTTPDEIEGYENKWGNQT
jgi:hypothetical protein